MRRMLQLLLLALAGVLGLGAFDGVPVGAADFLAEMGPAAMELPASLRPSVAAPCVGLVGLDGAGRPSPNRGKSPNPFLLPDPRPALAASVIRSVLAGHRDFAAAAALRRAGVHAWHTAAPPPSRSA